jgi:3-deoxy-D-manno-octulosonate 8-phosphate phosphatase (KDO 8-P phosphatase)
MELLKAVGISGIPADAPTYVKASGNMVLTKKGGEGAFREFVENIILQSGHQLPLKLE